MALMEGRLELNKHQGLISHPSDPWLAGPLSVDRRKQYKGIYLNSLPPGSLLLNFGYQIQKRATSSKGRAPCLKMPGWTLL